MTRRNDNQLELHPFTPAAVAEPPEPQPKRAPEPEPQPELPFHLETVDDYRQREPEVYAEGRTAAGTIKKEWRRLLPFLKPFHDFLSQRGINHVRGTTNCLPTWENWLARFVRETGLPLNARYVSSQVVEYEPGLPEWQPGAGVPMPQRQNHRAQSTQSQSQKTNPGAPRRDAVTKDKRLQPGDGAALGAQLVENCGKGGTEALRQSPSDEVIDTLQEAFSLFVKSVRPDLKITVMVCIDPDDSDLDLGIEI